MSEMAGTKGDPTQGSENCTASSLSNATVVLTDGTRVDAHFAVSNPYVRHAPKEVWEYVEGPTGELILRRKTDDNPHVWPNLAECFEEHLLEDLGPKIVAVLRAVEGMDEWTDNFGFSANPYLLKPCPIVKKLKEAQARLSIRCPRFAKAWKNASMKQRGIESKKHDERVYKPLISAILKPLMKKGHWNEIRSMTKMVYDQKTRLLLSSQQKGYIDSKKVNVERKTLDLSRVASYIDGILEEYDDFMRFGRGTRLLFQQTGWTHQKTQLEAAIKKQAQMSQYFKDVFHSERNNKGNKYEGKELARRQALNDANRRPDFMRQEGVRLWYPPLANDEIISQLTAWLGATLRKRGIHSDVLNDIELDVTSTLNSAAKLMDLYSFDTTAGVAQTVDMSGMFPVLKTAFTEKIDRVLTHIRTDDVWYYETVNECDCIASVEAADFFHHTVMNVMKNEMSQVSPNDNIMKTAIDNLSYFGNPSALLTWRHGLIRKPSEGTSYHPAPRGSAVNVVPLIDTAIMLAKLKEDSKNSPRRSRNKQVKKFVHRTGNLNQGVEDDKQVAATYAPSIHNVEYQSGFMIEGLELQNSWTWQGSNPTGMEAFRGGGITSLGKGDWFRVNNVVLKVIQMAVDTLAPGLSIDLVHKYLQLEVLQFAVPTMRKKESVWTTKSGKPLIYAVFDDRRARFRAKDLDDVRIDKRIRGVMTCYAETRADTFARVKGPAFPVSADYTYGTTELEYLGRYFFKGGKTIRWDVATLANIISAQIIAIQKAARMYAEQEVTSTLKRAVTFRTPGKNHEVGQTVIHMSHTVEKSFDQIANDIGLSVASLPLLTIESIDVKVFNDRRNVVAGKVLWGSDD